MRGGKLEVSGNGQTSKEYSRLKPILLCFVAAVLVLTAATDRASLGQSIGGGPKHPKRHHHGKRHGNHRHHHRNQPPSAHSPVATDDSYSVDEDQTLTVNAPGVLKNDSDLDNDPLTAVKASDPVNGTLTLNSDGSFTYTPKKDFNGTDSFTYKANDGTADSSAVTVTITVNPVDDAPMATDGTETMNENGAPITIDFGALVSDIETSDANLTYNIVSGPTAQQGTLSGSGSTRTFTPATDFNGTVQIAYTVTDRGDPDNCGSPSTSCAAAKTSDQKTVTVTVSPVNSKPVATDGTETMNEDGTPITIDFGALVSDKETSDANLTYNITDPDPAKGTLTGTGSTRTFTPAADFNGTVDIAYTVTDRGNPDNCGTPSATCAAAETSDQKTVTVTVNPVNDAPVAADQSVTTDEDVAKNITLEASDGDGDTLTYSIVSGPSHGTLSNGTGASRTYTPDSNYNGSDSFTFKANDGTADSNTATVSITINPVNDPPSFTKGPDQNKVTNQDANGNPKANTVDPWATGISAGPSNEGSQTVNFVIDSITYTATTCGTPTNLFTVAPAVSASGVLTFTTDPSQCGTATVTLHAHDNGGTDNGGVDASPTQSFTITTVNPPPVAVDDSYSATGNVDIDVNDANEGVLKRGTDDALNGGNLHGFGDTAANADSTVPNGSNSVTTANGGTVVLASDGTFTYNPPAGYTGADDNFYYDLHNSGGDAVGKVTITINDMIWFVDDSKSSAGDGRLSSPFNTLAGFQAINDGGTNHAKAGQTIFIATGSGDYTGGVTLLKNQYLIGQGASQSIETISGITPAPFSDSLPSTGGTPPSLTTSGGSVNAITLGSGNTIRGLTIGSTSGSGISGTSFGTLTVGSDVSINDTSGQALNLDTGTANASFGKLSSSGGTNGIKLKNVGGTISASDKSSALSGASGNELDIDGAAGSLTYPGSITKSGTGKAVSIVNKSGGTVALSGAVTDNGGGIFLNSNGGATVNLTGGVTLSTAANAAFTATGGGTVNVTGTNNTIATTTGTALNVANTTIGSSGLTFQRIDAGTTTSGPTNGIVLNSTGSSGGLTVTGNGGTCGSRTDTCTGGTIQKTSGDSISLTSTLSPSFARMKILDTTGSGVQGTRVTNFSFTNGAIDNSGDSCAGGNEEGNIAFNDTAATTENNLSGTVTITGNTLTNAFCHGVDIHNFDGTISNLNISNNSLTSSTSSATSKGTGIHILAFGSATTAANVTKATINSNTVRNFPSDAGITVQGGNSNASGPPGTMGTPNDGTNVIEISGNHISGASATNEMGTQAILAIVQGGNSGQRGQGNFNIHDNGTSTDPLANTVGNVISINASDFSTVTATANNNFIAANNHNASQGVAGGTLGAANSNPNLTVTANGNNISQTSGNGILFVTNGTNGTLTTKIQNNNVDTPTGTFEEGIRVDSGAASGGNATVCANISSNTTKGSFNSGHTLLAPGIGVRKQGTDQNVNKFGINGLSPSPASTAQTEAFLDGQNPNSQNGFNGLGADVISGDNFVSCSLP